MATAGYSGTPLIKKLGIKEETKVQLVNAPENYFKLLEADISKQVVKGKIFLTWCMYLSRNTNRLNRQ